MNSVPFIPNARGTIVIAASTASQSVQLPGGGGDLIAICNDGAVNERVYAELGLSTVNVFNPTTSGTGGFLVYPNTDPLAQIVRLRFTDTHIAIIAETGTPNIYITRGRLT